MLSFEVNMQSLSPSERWYLVHTRPQNERRAEFHLRAQGFRTYYPQIEKTIRHARQLLTVRAPLFARYVFVVLDLERDRWLSVRSTIGVSRLVTQDGRPLPVPCGVVETLIGQSDGGVTRLDSGLVEGKKVRIMSGPFADFVGSLKRLDDNGRVQVLIELMGTAVPISIARSVLSPAA
jgi:transcriptional antiterminator RfaH